MRAFFALPLPDHARDSVLAVQETLRRAAERHGLSLRWTRPEQLHATIKFLGDVDPADAKRLAERAAAHAARLPPILSEVVTVQAFGSPGRARVLIAALADPKSFITELARCLEDDAAEIGIEKEARAFTPHLTFARFKPPAPAAPILRESVPLPIPLVFDNLVLF